MPTKGFKKEAIGDLRSLIEVIVEPEVVKEKPKKKMGRPFGAKNKKKLAKDIRDRILERFDIDEFLDLMAKDPRVLKYYYLELLPKMLPRMTEKEVEEKFGVTFMFGEEKRKEEKSKKKEEPEKPFVLTLTEAPKPEGF